MAKSIAFPKRSQYTGLAGAVRLRKTDPQRISLYKHALIIVAEGARVDLTKQLLENGELPNIQEHIVDRGCFRTALSVFPSATGPTHVPIFTGLHPGTANVPGCRWLCRRTHDTRRRSIYRHRSLNGIGGLMAGRDVDAEKSTSLFEYFERPSSVMELIDFRPGRPLFKVVAGRLQRMACARRTGDREGVDRTVEQLIIRRIKAGSDCITGCFFGIDKNSHAYGPLSGHTVAAYKSVDRAVGNIASVLQKRGSYDQTIIAVVSDHGLSSTTAHVPLVDIVKDHGFRPYHYPGLYRRDRDSAVMESDGGALLQAGRTVG